MNVVLKSLKTCSRRQLDHSIIHNRQQQAYDIKIKWDEICPEHIHKVFSSWAQSIGTPPEFLFFPFITLSSAMMHIDTQVNILPTWSEPPIIWNIVAARKGEKKSPALRLLINALQTVEEVERSQNKRENLLQQNREETKKLDGDKEEKVLYMTNTQFTFHKLHGVMKANGGEALLVYDEIASLYEQLDNSTSGSQSDRKILLSLNGGDAWCKASQNSGHQSMNKTLFNYTGFMQPTVAAAMLTLHDFDGFNDRHMAIICAKRTPVMFEEMILPPEGTLKLGEILSAIRQTHSVGRLYTLDGTAQQSFAEFYNSLERRMEEMEYDEDHKGVLAKAQGQAARLAMVYQAIFDAVEELKHPETDDTSDAAINDMDDINEEKNDITEEKNEITEEMNNATQELFTSTPMPNTPWVSQRTNGEPFSQSTIIAKSTMDFAINTVNLCIQHKFALMPPPVGHLGGELDNAEQVEKEIPNAADEDSFENIQTEYPTALKVVLTNAHIKPGIPKPCCEIASRHTIPAKPNATGNKYPTTRAISFLTKVGQLGFGDMCGNKGKSFRKKPFADLSPNAKKILQELDVTEQMYTNGAASPKKRKLTTQTQPSNSSGQESQDK